MPTVLTSIRLPEELYEWLKDKAEKEHRTLSNTLIAVLLDASKSNQNDNCSPVLLKNQHKPYGDGLNANAPWVSRCPKCGKKVEGKQTRFCKYCGQSVRWE